MSGAATEASGSPVWSRTCISAAWGDVQRKALMLIQPTASARRLSDCGSPRFPFLERKLLRSDWENAVGEKRRTLCFNAFAGSLRANRLAS